MSVESGRVNQIATSGELDVKTLEAWLWDAACQIRGPLDAPKFKDYILPLIFVKRLSDVFEDEVARVAEEVGDLSTAHQVVDSDHSVVRFYIPDDARWENVSKHTTQLGERLTDAVRAIARINPRLQGVIDTVDFNATAAGQQIVDNDRLAALVRTLGQHRLGLRDVQPDLIGHAYEYLLRKFAEGQGQSAGEFYTPAEVGQLMARLLDPQPGMTVYDPACGSGGLLIKCHLRLLETDGVAVNEHRELPRDTAPLKLFGQEINPSTFAMAKMNAVLHDMDADIALGDTMRSPAFTAPSGGLQTFDLVTANPMWNQDFPETMYRNDATGRFEYGIPPSSSGDWGWIQHMYASLKPRGRMALVLDTGAASRGTGSSGSARELGIRRSFVRQDVVEAVILLPENLFYNQPSAGLVMVFNRAKTHPKEVLFVDASMLFEKSRPKNVLSTGGIRELIDAYINWVSVPGVSAVVRLEDINANGESLLPTRYVGSTPRAASLSFDAALKAVQDARQRQADADAALERALAEIHTDGI